MDVARLIERIERVDVASASVGELASVMGDLGRLKGWVGSTEAAAAHRAGELERSGQASSAADLISRGTKTSRRSAEKTQRRGAALAQAPGVEQQLAAGRISTEHADALATAAGKLDDEQRSALFERDEQLARRAASQTPAQFARTLSKAAAEISLDDGIERSEQQRRAATLSHGINADTGMGWIRAELHPDDYQKVKRRLDAEVNAMKRLPKHEGRRYEQLGADALVALVTGGRAASRVPAEVSLLIDHQTLSSGPHADTVCEYSDGNPLPAETARRHACDAKIIPAVLDSIGMPLDVGRGARHATLAQRTALRAMYRTCGVDGCDTGFDRCEMHHLVEWNDLGDTDLENLVPVCSFHHHRAHEGRWRLQLEPSTRQLSVFLPDGSLHSRCLPDMVAERADSRTAA
ncbi:MAG: hypothetical protein AB8G14_09690 [Ilumatobacter sp.]